MKQKTTIEGIVFLIGFTLCIPLANWMIGNVGICQPQQPCVIPVWPSIMNLPAIMAPSGVLLVGLALVLRDLVQRRLGKLWSLVAIAFGALLTYVLQARLSIPEAVVIGSTVAFLLSELADFAIYTPLQKRRLILAVVASSLVGLVVDSVVFLQIAFKSQDFLLGQIIGKAWMVLLAIPLIWLIRESDERRGIKPA